MYNAVCNVWVQYGVAALVTTAVMACSGFISGPFALAMAVDGVVAGGIILSSVTKFVNAKKDRKISVDMLCKTHNLLKHRSVFDVKTGDKEVNDASRPVIRLENVVHCHRNIKDVPESINGEPNPEFGKRSDKALFASDKTIDIGTGITILGGDSGAGKSTLLSLIMHEDDVTHGSISVGHYDKDGQFVGDDLRELDMGSYMSKIAYQMVNPEWTECSVKEYITGGRDVDPAKLKKICEILDIKEEGPDGLHFDRKIDISDPKFSEGEQKRLAIAQTLLKDTPIMIFDEPTANIGDKMKCALLDYIAQNAADKTVIFISHSPTDLKRLKETMPQQAQFQALHLCAQEKGPACIDQYNLRDSEKWEQYISKISVEEQTRQAGASQSEEGKQENISQVQQENKELQQKVEEQQATINQLQKQISQLRELALIGSLYTNITSYPTAENKSSKTETTSSQPKKNNKFAFHLVKKVSDSACAK